MKGSRGDCSPLDERILAVLNRLDVLPDTPEVHDDMRRLRQQNLEQGGAKTAITAEDFQAIVRDQLADTMALATVQRWIACAFRGARARNGKPVPRFLMLQGERGRGKTVAAAWAIANETGYYITAGEFRRARYSYAPLDVEKRTRAQIAKLLVLDDLGYESTMGERDQEWLFELVNDRQGPGVYTIITTNADTEAWFPGRYGDRAYERIAHQGGIVPVVGPNLRKRWASAAG
jgi:DNA replication protein DnaC